MVSQQTGTGQAPQPPRGGTPGGGTSGADVKAATQDVAQQTQQKAGEIVEQAKAQVVEQATNQVASQKDRAVASIGSVADALRQASKHLKENEQAPVAQYADKAADRVDQFVKQLDGKEVQEILRDVERYARRQPAIFLGGAFAVGLIAARFLKSTGQREDDGGDPSDRRSPSYGGGGYGAYGYGSAAADPKGYGRTDYSSGAAAMRTGGSDTGARSWSVRGSETR